MSKAPLAFNSIDSTLGLLNRIRRNLTFCGSLKILLINLSKISLASWKVLGSLSVNFLTIEGKNKILSLDLLSQKNVQLIITKFLPQHNITSIIKNQSINHLLNLFKKQNIS